MPTVAQRLADRFKPGIFERIRQSREAKQRQRNREQLDAPTIVVTPAPQHTPHTAPTGAGNAWDYWQLDTRCAPTSACTTNVDPWGMWNIQRPNTAASATTTLWTDWNVGHTVALIPFLRETAVQRRNREDQERRYEAELAAANARYYEEQRAVENRRKEAEDRAMKLLVSVLNDQQKADLKRDRHFFVEAPSGRLYRIDYGTHGNVKLVDRVTRRVVEHLCIQPNGVPAGDANVMQKLMIETAEDVFRSHANITLADGSLIRGSSELLTGEKLARVIPIRNAA